MAAFERLDTAHKQNSIVFGLRIHCVEEPASEGFNMLQEVLEWQKRWNIEDDQKHCIAASWAMDFLRHWAMKRPMVAYLDVCV